MSHIYIISKPLQLTIVSIIAGKSSVNATLIITDMFANARDVFEKLKLNNTWSKVYFVRNRFQSFLLAAMLRPIQLFIDGDIGTRLAVYISIVRFFGRCKIIYVYEEGIGTYRNDIYVKGFRKKVFDLMGIATFFGGSWFCKGVYVYHPEKYKKSHNVKSSFLINTIKYKVQEYTNDNFIYLSKLYSFKTKDICRQKIIKLYISSYCVSTTLLDELSNSKEEVVVKLHPQLKTNKYMSEYKNIHFVENQVPAELLICYLAKSNESVTVFHHGSSVESYMSYKNVEYIKV